MVWNKDQDHWDDSCGGIFYLTLSKLSQQSKFMKVGDDDIFSWRGLDMLECPKKTEGAWRVYPTVRIVEQWLMTVASLVLMNRKNRIYKSAILTPDETSVGAAAVKFTSRWLSELEIGKRAFEWSKTILVIVEWAILPLIVIGMVI